MNSNQKLFVSFKLRHAFVCQVSYGDDLFSETNTELEEMDMYSTAERLGKTKPGKHSSQGMARSKRTKWLSW